jgi:hypothetical protein
MVRAIRGDSLELIDRTASISITIDSKEDGSAELIVKANGQAAVSIIDKDTLCYMADFLRDITTFSVDD